MNRIIESYAAEHQESRALFDKSRSHFPDGVTHDGRYLEPFPLFMTDGSGPRKTDVDGHGYIDYVMGHGALILGHADSGLVAAVSDQVKKGTHLGANTALELAWVERVKSLMPTIGKVRFHSSGTEAVAMTLRLARAFTGRTKIAKLSRHFHGWSDGVAAEPMRYSSVGIPPGTTDATVRLKPGDSVALARLLEHMDVAAVIVEPTGAQMGSFPLSAAYLQSLRELTGQYGSLLIFDEVVTGFRVSPGGAHRRFGIKPDLCTLGKILGGGLPGAASAGSREIMDAIAHRDDPSWNADHRVGHPGTFNANPLSAAAGVACLDRLISEPINERADRAACRLKEGINRSCIENRIVGFAHGLSSIVKVVFGMEAPADEESLSGLHLEIADATDPEIGRMFKLAMLNRGVDTMGGGRFIVSAVHSDDDIDQTIDAFGHAVAAMKTGGFLRSLP